MSASCHKAKNVVVRVDAMGDILKRVFKLGLVRWHLLFASVKFLALPTADEQEMTLLCFPMPGIQRRHLVEKSEAISFPGSAQPTR